MRQRNARGEGSRLREEILDGVVTLMASDGSDETLSLRGVARAVGVSPQSMYLHFPDLDALVTAALARCMGDLGETMARAADTESDPVARLLARADAYIEWGIGNPGVYQVVFEGRVQGSAPEIGAGSAVGAAIRVSAEQDVSAAMAAGDLPSGDPRALAFAMWALLHGIVSLRVNKPHAPWPPPEELAQLGIRRLLGLA